MWVYVLINVDPHKNLMKYESLSQKLITHYVKNTKKMKARLGGLKKEIASKELIKKSGNVWTNFMKTRMKR